jgi:hypothetical protein
MADILVDPADRSRGFVVVAYVAHELARQILYRSEDASRNTRTGRLPPASGQT